MAALKVFFAIIGSGQTLQALLSDLIICPQVMINVRCEKPVDVNQDPAIIAAVADVEQQLGDSGRVLLRPSGTEPLIRVMVEGQDEQLVGQLTQQLADQVEAIVA